ncbi:hypothetical protein PCK1_000738, partial [Pneumocystis canis]
IFKTLIRYCGKIHQNFKKISQNCSNVEFKTEKKVGKVENKKCNETKTQLINGKIEIQKRLPKYVGLEKYTLIEKMGDGAYSDVYKAICNDSKEYVAIKVIRKYKLNYSQKVSVFKEIRIMQDIDHPNIVRLLGFLENDDYYFLILELLEGGEVFHQIVRLTYFSENLSRHIITQVAHAIRYLHEKKGVVHRDIKPENILFKPIPFIPSKHPKIRTGEDITKEDEGEFIQAIGSGGIGQVKIADFGLSKVIWDKQTMTPCGTISYTAPEIIKDQKYSKCVDMWALGCVLYTFLCGFPPFYDDNVQVLSRKVVRGEYSFLSPWWDEISKSSQDLISNLLTTDPKKRYTIDQFLNHPWILESDKENLSFDNMSHVSNSMTISPTIPSLSRIKNSPVFRELKKDARSPDIVSLHKAFNISYMIQCMKEENMYLTPMILADNFCDNENINYFREVLQKNISFKTHSKAKERTSTISRNSKNVSENKDKSGNDVFTRSGYFPVTPIIDGFLQKSCESQFELFLEKSTLLCRRKALIEVDT